MTVHRYVLARYSTTGQSTRVTWLDDPCPRPACWSWVEFADVQDG
jgi:hypothetical protein